MRFQGARSTRRFCVQGLWVGQGQATSLFDVGATDLPRSEQHGHTPRAINDGGLNADIAFAAIQN